MKIAGFKELFGPNVYTEKPLLGMLLDLEEYAERRSATLPGFTDRLMAALPMIAPVSGSGSPRVSR